MLSNFAVQWSIAILLYGAKMETEPEVNKRRLVINHDWHFVTNKKTNTWKEFVILQIYISLS